MSEASFPFISGALVPRLLGQKKVRSEDGSHNVMLLHEFFSRFSHLRGCLLENLTTGGQTCLVRPGTTSSIQVPCGFFLRVIATNPNGTLRLGLSGHFC